MKKIFFLTLSLVVGLFFAQLSYATAELIWDNSPSWVASKNMKSWSIRAGDLNNDGFPDVVQADYYGGQLYIYYNNAGQLSSTPSWSSSEIVIDSYSGFFDVQLADINSDGFLDIIAMHDLTRKVYIYTNNNGQFNLQADWVSNKLCNYGGWVTKPADIDSDGDMDLLVQCGAGSLNLLKNNAGTLTKNAVWSSSERLSWWVQLDVADYDGDGVMEVAMPNGYEGSGAFPNFGDYRTFVYKYNSSTGGFDVIWKSPVGGGPAGAVAVTHAYWADYDNDGDLDLITSDGFCLKQTIFAAPIIMLAENIDYDMDGDEDLLLAYNGTAKIYSNRFVETHNKPPLANAGTDQTASCYGANGAAVTLDGSGSSDPDNDALTYTWTGIFGTATGVNPQVQIPLGTYTVTLKVDDGKGGAAEDTVVITVQDTVPPSTSAAITGTSGNNGWYTSDVNVSLISADNCSGVKEIHYILDGAETIISGSTGSFTISADGTHSLSFRAVDNANNSETAHPATINIDRTPPVLNVTVTPGLLWPPNHKMVNIMPLIAVSDNLTSNVQVELIEVTSSEPDNGLGDGDTANDIVVNADGTISLRAKRSGTGNGRVYTITYKATDLAGNVTVASATVVVPHDMGKK
ncbi:MAG: VCBS repeat-containing protein [Nitrospirae bacterium]|nr:VCBS repeat-containing protein [Nitrospirota bacterium]